MRGLRFIGAILIASICSVFVSCIGVNRKVPQTTRQLIPGVVGTIGSGSTPSLARKQWEVGGVVYRVDGLVVVMPAECSDHRAACIISHIRYTVAAFEADYAKSITDYTVFVTDRPSFPMEIPVFMQPILPPELLPPGAPRLPRFYTNLIGVCCSSVREIAVVTGNADCLPALYHEFAHAFLDINTDHKGPEWERIESRGDQISAELRSRHPYR